MNTFRKARWAVRQSGLPVVVRPCPDCSGRRHHPSGRFRVNASGKLLDVWLLLRCAMCGRTSKVPVHERVHVSSLEPARRLSYETNDPSVIQELAMSASLAARNGYRLDWAGAWALETDSSVCALREPTPLKVLISFELPAPVRVERLLMLGLGLSRTEVRRGVADGRIRLPLAPDAKAYQDFELTVDRSGSALLAKCRELCEDTRGGLQDGGACEGAGGACEGAGGACEGAGGVGFSPTEEVRSAVVM
ncbi:DUF1062 domain-containing protein [Streptomyces sp. NPDC004658]|uniref:DUF1062 domain-containing protein n=1 Tax=Streptomyces sp. NPDC004658 TaxID=3154672 RepID=UPI0033B37798